MADPLYAQLRAQATSLITQFQQGAVAKQVVTYTPGADPDDPPTASRDTVTLPATIRGASSKFVDGQTVLATDLQGMFTTAAVIVSVGDVVSIDGKDHTVTRRDNIPAAGDPVAIRLFLRG